MGPLAVEKSQGWGDGGDGQVVGSGWLRCRRVSGLLGVQAERIVAVVCGFRDVRCIRAEA